MILSTKNINLKTSNNKVNITLSLKKSLNNVLNSKTILKSNNNTKSLSVSNQANSLVLKSFTKSLNVKAYNFKPLGVFVPEPVNNTVTFTKRIPVGNSMFSFALDITKIRNNSGNVVDYTQLGIDVFLKNFIYENISDEESLFYKNESKYAEVIQTVKNNTGGVYIPQYEFNGIGNPEKFMGYDIRVFADSEMFFKYTGEPFENINTISDLNLSFNNSWYKIGTAKTAKIQLEEFFKPLLDEDKIKIIKDYKGGVMIPEWGFDGIGDLLPGEAYLVKFKNM